MKRIRCLFCGRFVDKNVKRCLVCGYRNVCYYVQRSDHIAVYEQEIVQTTIGQKHGKCK